MAEKKGGKEAGPDDIMSASEMKPILASAKHGTPASCAIGLTKAKDGVILLDKKRPPKQLLAEIKKKAAAAGLELDATSLRFGHAVVDAETDASLLTFTVNKEPSGALRPKLLDHVKKAGFGKIEITVDAGLESEPGENGQAASPDAAAAPDQPDAAAAPEQDVAPPDSAPAPDAATLTKTLTDLVKHLVPVLTANPQLGAGLKTLATQAQASLKAGDLVGAAGSIGALQQALDGAAAAPAPAAAGASAPDAHAKSRLVWIATRQKVESDLAKLKSGIIAACDGQDIEAALEDGFRSHVEPVLGNLDDSLSGKLDEVNKATDPAQRTKLLGEAKQILQRYQSYVASEPILAELDANPFVPLTIQKTLTATLSALSATLR
jgi:hypothetical protein